MPSESAKSAIKLVVSRGLSPVIPIAIFLMAWGSWHLSPKAHGYCIEDYPPEVCASVRDAAAQTPWTKEYVPKLLQVLCSVERIQQFACTFYTKTEEEEAYLPVSRPFTGPVLDSEEISVLSWPPECLEHEYGFFDLHGDGRVQLVAIDHYGFAESFFVVEESGGSFSMFSIDNHTEINGLSNVMYHPEGSLSTLLLGREILEWPEGWAHADRLPTLTHVYEWNGKDWVQADTKHKDYYAKVVLPPLEAELAGGPCPDEDDAGRAKCRTSLEKEIAAVKAILAAP